MADAKHAQQLPLPFLAGILGILGTFDILNILGIVGTLGILNILGILSIRVCGGRSLGCRSGICNPNLGETQQRLKMGDRGSDVDDHPLFCRGLWQARQCSSPIAISFDRTARIKQSSKRHADKRYAASEAERCSRLHAQR